jgi:hypothetical protein
VTELPESGEESVILGLDPEYSVPLRMEGSVTLSPDEAAGALREAAVETCSQRVYGDRQSSLHLIVWGVLGPLGYGLTEPWPQSAWVNWIAIVGMGPAAKFAISASSAGGGARQPATLTIRRDRAQYPTYARGVPGYPTDRLSVHRRDAGGHGIGHQPPSRHVHPGSWSRPAMRSPDCGRVCASSWPEQSSPD